MRNDAQLQAPRQVRITTKGELVRAVQHRRSEIAIRVGIVERGRAHVLVRGRGVDWTVAEGPARVLKPGECVRNLKVQRSYSSKRVLHILYEFGLQSVVHRTANRFGKYQRRALRINARESAVVANLGNARLIKVGRGGQAIIGKVRNARPAST